VQVGLRNRFKAEERSLRAAATFSHQRHEPPERNRGDRQCDAQRRVARGEKAQSSAVRTLSIWRT
jgi:hypothetical protein